MRWIACWAALAAACLGHGYTPPNFSEYCLGDGCAWGDMDGDGQYTDRDIDMFGWANYYSTFPEHDQLHRLMDSDGNGRVDLADKDFILQFVMGVHPFDFDLDGDVDLSGDGSHLIQGLGHVSPQPPGQTLPVEKNYTGFAWGDYTGDGLTNRYDAARFLERYQRPLCDPNKCAAEWVESNVFQNPTGRPVLDPLFPIAKFAGDVADPEFPRDAQDLVDAGYLQGDFDLDGVIVASVDGATMLSNFGMADARYQDGDANFDGTVTAAGDGGIYLANQNANDAAAVPEAPMLVLVPLALGFFLLAYVAFSGRG